MYQPTGRLSQSIQGIIAGLQDFRTYRTRSIFISFKYLSMSLFLAVRGLWSAVIYFYPRSAVRGQRSFTFILVSLTFTLPFTLRSWRPWLPAWLRPVTPIFMNRTRASGHMLEAQGHMHEYLFE